MRQNSHGGAVRSPESRPGRGGLSWRWERGQTLVIAALLMIVLIGALALVVDVGHAYTQRRLVQNAADAGALAGVRALALDQTTAAIDAAVDEYTVRRNPGQSYEMEVLTATRSVPVTVTKTFSTFFASMVGAPTMTVVATAEGVYKIPKITSGLAPLAVQKDAVKANEDGSPVEIWDSAVEHTDPGIISGGERGWVNFLNSGKSPASPLPDWIINGYGGDVYSAEACEDMGSTDPNCAWIQGIPGTMSTGMQDVDVTYAPFTVTQRVMLVPVYDTVRQSQYYQPPEDEDKIDYHIVGFAAFKIDEVKMEKGDKDNPAKIWKIKGWFDSYVHLGPVDEDEDWDEDLDFGVRVIGLRR